MADIRIKDLPTTASDFSSDDFIAIDGTANGTRKINAKTANLTFSDVTLGTSGPSVKSSLAARAARQGLDFNGATGSTVAGVPAFGTNDFTFSVFVTPQSLASNGYIASGNVSGFGAVVLSTGLININCVSVALVGSSNTALTVAKTSHIVYTRSGTTGRLYINGIQDATWTDDKNYTSAIGFVGMVYDGTQRFTGKIIAPNIFNRALSATEVVSLYESGVPSKVNYGSGLNAPGTNSIINAARNSTFTAGVTDWYGATGGSITSGGIVTITPSNVSRVELADNFNTIRSGYNYRISLTVTGFTAGTDPVILRGSLIGGTNVTINGNGTFTVPDFTANTNSAYVQIINLTGTGSGSNCTFTISSIVVTALGLLLAPDAAQAGGGLAWYDTSGNAANITLPASGVTWNVPTSGYFTAPNTTNLTLAGGSTGASLVLGQGASGSVGINPKGTGTLNVGAAGLTNSFNLNVYGASGTNLIAMGADSSVGLLGAYSAAFAARTLALQTAGGNLLIGTTTDGGQKLQVNGTASFAGAVTASNATANTPTLSLAATATSTGISFLNTIPSAPAGERNWAILTNSAAYGDLVLKQSNAQGGNPITAGTAALSFDVNRAATFAGAVTAGGDITIGGNTAPGANIIQNASAGNFRITAYKTAGVDRWYVGVGTAAESGSNAGANFQFSALTDTGGTIDNPLTIIRAAGGAITMARPVSLTNVTPSTGAGSGALQVAGGIYSGAASYFAGTLKTPSFEANAGDVRAKPTGGYFYVQNGSTAYFAVYPNSTYSEIASLDAANKNIRFVPAASGSVVVNNAAVATTATNGFLYVPTCAGAPTGVPASHTGTAPIVIDTTNNKLYFYSGGAWRDAGP